VSYGQDFFRDLGTSRSSGGIGPVYPSEYGYQDGSPSGLRDLQPGYDPSLPEQTEDADKYNFAIGDVRFGVAAGIGIEWNDNIKLSENDRLSDFILRPILNLESRWQMSDLNTLRFSIGVSYAKYFDHTQYDTDGVLISPNSELALSFYLGSVKFTVRDRFGYQEDAYDVPQLSNVAIYGRWENQAGFDMEWAINQAFTFTAGYDHYNLWTNGGGEFSLQDRAIDTVFLKPAFQVSPALKIGLNASYSWINFDDSSRSDGNNLLVGPFIEWQISEYTNLYLEGGYQSLQFNNGSDFNNSAIDQLNLSKSDAEAVRNILRDNEDSNNYYVKFEINNRPSEFFRHRLLFSKTSEIGFASDFYDIYNVGYDAEWKAFEHCEIGPTVFYEHYTSSGSLGEEADRVGASIGIRYHFSNSLTLGLDYRYIWKNSNLDGADYYQNLAFLSLYYKF
jgi:hypothetical protein